MRQKSVSEKEPATQVVKNIRRATRRHFSAEDKIRIVLEGLRGEDSIAELCRREGIVQNLYYRWSKDFLEAGKKRLLSDFFTRRLLSDYRASSSQAFNFLKKDTYSGISEYEAFGVCRHCSRGTTFGIRGGNDEPWSIKGQALNKHFEVLGFVGIKNQGGAYRGKCKRRLSTQA